MKREIWVPIFLVLSVACQKNVQVDTGGSLEENPNTPVRIMVAKDMEHRVAHWKLEASMGVIVAMKDQGTIDDRAKLLLQQEFERIFQDYHLRSANLCKNKKPSPEWSDDEWSEFREKPIARLNAALGTSVIEGIYCEGMVFTEYEFVVPSTPEPNG